MIDMISRGPPGVGLGARHRPRERGPQRAAALQLGALPGGARLRREGVDHAGPVPLGGRALPLPLRESVGCGRTSSPHPPIWIPGVMSRNTVAWCGQAPLPVRHARHPSSSRPRPVVRLYYDQVAKEHGYEAGAPAPRLPVQGPRRRDRGAGLARPGRKLRRGPAQHLPRGQPGQAPTRCCRTCRA